MPAQTALRAMEPVVSPMDAGSDEALMLQLSQGQDIALAELVRRYQNDLFRFCLHYLKNVDSAKEMAQETFLRVFAARDRFDVERKFKPWMLCIARNLCLNEIKRKKTVQMEALEDYASSGREDSGEMLQSPADGAVEQLMAQERHKALQQALNKLPHDAREIVTLRYFERLSAREIADIVDSTEGAVRTRLHRVLKQLRDTCSVFRDDV
jgi:RNA polymerase sigma-70 factor (ECF subfamily)